MNILYDNETSAFEDDTLVLRIRTGRTQAYKNLMQSLRLQNPALGMQIENEINEVAEDASVRFGQQMVIPNVPEILIYSRQAGKRQIDVCIAWGIVTNGATRRGALMGEFRFILCLEREIERALSQVFELERVLMP